MAGKEKPGKEKPGKDKRVILMELQATEGPRATRERSIAGKNLQVIVIGPEVIRKSLSDRTDPIA